MKEKSHFLFHLFFITRISFYFLIQTNCNLFFHTFVVLRCNWLMGKRKRTIDYVTNEKRISFLIAFFCVLHQITIFLRAPVEHTEYMKKFVYFFFSFSYAMQGNWLIFTTVWDDFKNILSPFEKREKRLRHTFSRSHSQWSFWWATAVDFVLRSWLNIWFFGFEHFVCASFDNDDDVLFSFLFFSRFLYSLVLF